MAGTVGLVPLVGRGPVVYATFRERPLFLSAVDALSASGVRRVVVLAAPEQLASAGRTLSLSPAVELVECPDGESHVGESVSVGDIVVVHEPLCPLVPASVLRHAVERWEAGTASVAVLDVVDTVKATRDEVVRSTLDRSALRIVASPVVLSGALLQDLPELTAALSRPASLVAGLAGRCPLRIAAASPLSMRVEDASSLRVLAAFGALTAAG
ncbi:MAG: 2-C-methyl-D-erythritol 4-phosphate cytidylyltransferase [Nocardioidaceae bacterium]|jgi:2-C-methyl-D-erythritol 4-phosphate cytidylyltransferase|nr:2-C-methyl-D-erythritol 4-phosphate cytidylyltransferase [Nocardioidaceae bacterium]